MKTRGYSKASWITGLLAASAFGLLLAGCGGGGGGGVTIPLMYSIDGSISGQTGNVQIALSVNNTQTSTITVPQTGSTFTFPLAAKAQDTYQITISTPPTGEDCSVTALANGSVSGNVTGVQVYCTPWLYVHNQLRQQLNSGSLPHSPAPTTPIARLEWDPKLAQVAQNFANGCSYGHNSSATSDYQALGGTATYVGENIAMSSTILSEQQTFNLWSSEEASFVYEPMTSTDATTFGHYSQLIWRNTTYVGCAVAACTGTYPYFAVCDYAPGGNIISQYPY